MCEEALFSGALEVMGDAEARKAELPRMAMVVLGLGLGKEDEKDEEVKKEGRGLREERERRFRAATEEDEVFFNLNRK